MWDRPMLAWKKAHERTLRALRVDEDGPGTILADFETFVTFVRGRDLPVSKVNQLPPRKVLPQINALLRRPVEVRLQQPQLKSYPHLQGLYLLLRATGLGRIGGPPAKPVLIVDAQVYDAWSALNLTERYFTLLEAWLLRGRPEIVGERDPVSGIGRQFSDLAELLRRAGSGGLPIAGNDQVQWFWLYSPGRMGIALLELFGLAAVVSGASREREGWVVERVSCTPLGEAIFALLYKELFSDFAKWTALDDALPTSVGALRPILSPFVSQWQYDLMLPSRGFREGRHIFKVSLARDLWRRIAIDAKQPLDALAGAILDAYDFDHDHLYQFSYRNRFGVEERIQHPYLDDGPWTSEVRIGDLPLEVGQSMTYLYDFGDFWQFEVTLEQVDLPKKGRRKPELLDGRGDAPEQYRTWSAV